MQQMYKDSSQRKSTAWFYWVILVVVLSATNPSSDSDMRTYLHKQKGAFTMIRHVKAVNLMVASVHFTETGLLFPTRSIYLGVCGTYLELGHW